MVAQLVDHFHLTPQEIGKLTRVQINKIYLWERDKNGGLVPPLTSIPPKPIQKKISREDMLKLLAASFKAGGVKCKGLTDQNDKANA
jgi:hypothetical protein